MTFNGPIGDLIKFSIGGGWGSDQPKNGFSEVAVIRGTDIPKVTMGDFSTVPRRFESKTKLANRLLEVGDLVLETAGGSSANGQFTGRTLLVTEEILSSLGPTICASFCKRLALDSSSVEPEYFYWYMQDLYSSGRVAIYDSQSTGISNFQFANFLDAEILILPKPATQRVIAQSLSKLNELIVLNRQVTKSLEEIAQTIFRSWFIDFDPVKAKMAGEKPVGMDDATAALFPDSMVDSELGPIPLSWKLGTLEDACLILDSKRVPLSGAERKKRPGKIPYFGATGILDFVDSHLFEGPHVLVGEDGSVITKSGNPFVQYVWGKFWVSNHAHVLQGRGGFSVEQLKLFLDRIQISNYVTGAVQPKLNQGNLKSIPCLLPVVNVSEAFNLIIGPMFDEIRELSEQTKLLVEIRDRLLPRLISGELQIPEEMLGV